MGIDVLVLAVKAAQCLKLNELWVAFGQLAAHEIAKALGPDHCMNLLMFNTFTGCDTVSCFGGRGKRTAWDTWMNFPDVTESFSALATTPETIDSWMQAGERFVVLLYDRTGSQNYSPRKVEV